MKTYYVNTNPQANGDHEVHVEGCNFMPHISNRKYLGVFSSCYPAVKKAKETFPSANGCYYCCRECHTS
jgi:hypothetical protein